MPRPGWSSVSNEEIGTAMSNPLTITICEAKSGKQEKSLYRGDETEWFKGPARYEIKPTDQGTSTNFGTVYGSDHELKISIDKEGRIRWEVESPGAATSSGFTDDDPIDVHQKRGFYGGSG